MQGGRAGGVVVVVEAAQASRTTPSPYERLNEVFSLLTLLMEKVRRLRKMNRGYALCVQCSHVNRR